MNMTAKEKAEDLFFKFSDCGDTPDAYAINHAIIAVDEILNIHFDYDPDKEYWQEVKQHLEEMI